MASSLYQNAGPGRPPPPHGSYRQNQPPPPPPPPGQYGAPNPYNNYSSGPPPPPYTASGPPRQMTYNPTYVYGSSLNSGSYGPPGVPSQNEYTPLSQFSLPPPPPPPLPLPSAPAPPPPHPTQVPHQRLSFTSAVNSSSQPHQSGLHTPYYPSSVPSHPTQLPPPPPIPLSHSSSSQVSSYGNFPSSLSKQQSLPPPPPLPSHNSLNDLLNSSVSAPPPLSSSLSSQSAPPSAVASRQSAPEIPVLNNWVSGGDASNAGTTQANWGSGRDGNHASANQGAWNLPSSQPLVYPASIKAAASSQEMTTGVLQADLVPAAKTAKPLTSSKPPVPGIAHKADGRFESEQDHREKKKREYERKKLEEKREKEMQPGSILHKILPPVTPLGKYSSGSGLRDGQTDKKSGHSLEKVDNRLKRPSTFLCKMKFRNELPDPVSQPKLLQVNNDKDRYTKYTITSLEKTQKHKLLVDPNLGIPLDLLDISVYNPPKVKPHMHPDDEELLRDDEKIPSVKTESIRKKDRPTDKGLAWLVKTQYISPINLEIAKQSLTAKQAKELKEIREGKRDILESLNDREQQICSIEESFRAAKERPVHQRNPGLEPVEILPLLPDFERWGDRLSHIIFDGEPTADSELHSKLDSTVRDGLESQAILKSFVITETESGNQERFLGYMVPKVDELNKDMFDENDDMSYTWMREYHFNMRSEDPQNMATYVFTFGQDAVRFLPLQTKLTLQKKKSKEGRSKEEAESLFAVPSSVTIRRRALSQEEEEEREAHRLALTEETEAHRLALTEGNTPAVDSKSHHAKRRHSDEAELLPVPKRQEINDRDRSDDEEEVYM